MWVLIHAFFPLSSKEGTVSIVSRRIGASSIGAKILSLSQRCLAWLPSGKSSFLLVAASVHEAGKNDPAQFDDVCLSDDRE